MNFQSLYNSIIEKTAWKKHGVEFDDSVIGQLLPYVNDESYYLHFTELNKLGNNPKSDYNTPQGIYLYPLWKCWEKFLEMYPTFDDEQYKTDKKYRKEFKFTDVIPFKSNSKNIIVGKLKNIRQFYDFKSYITNTKYQYIIEKLKKYMYGLHLDNKFFETDVDYKARVDELIKDGEGETTLKNNLGKLWNVTRLLSNSEDVNTHITGNKDITKWTYLLYNVLGIEGFVDSAGVGIIHINEPVQAVVFSANNIEAKTVILNKEQFSLKGEQKDIKAKHSQEVKKIDDLVKVKNLLKSDVVQLEGFDKKVIKSALLDSVNHPDKKYILPKDCSYLCANFNVDGRIGFNWYTSNVNDMTRMFDNATLDLDASKWVVSNVQIMTKMFLNSNVKVDVSKWVVSGVNDMDSMFSRCDMNPDVSGWDVSNVKYMSDMFGFNNLADPDVSGWDVSNVKYMNDMFCGCAIANPNVSKWDVSKVTDMTNMFAHTELAKPDVSNWDVSSLIKYRSMFQFAKFTEFDVSKWMNYENISNVCTTIGTLKKILTNYDYQ